MELKGVRPPLQNNWTFTMRGNSFQRLTEEETGSQNTIVPSTTFQGCQQYPSNENLVVNPRITDIDYFIWGSQYFHPILFVLFLNFMLNTTFLSTQIGFCYLAAKTHHLVGGDSYSKWN